MNVEESCDMTGVVHDLLNFSVQDRLEWEMVNQFGVYYNSLQQEVIRENLE